MIFGGMIVLIRCSGYFLCFLIGKRRNQGFSAESGRTIPAESARKHARIRASGIPVYRHTGISTYRDTVYLHTDPPARPTRPAQKDSLLFRSNNFRHTRILYYSGRIISATKGFFTILWPLLSCKIKFSR